LRQAVAARAGTDSSCRNLARIPRRISPSALVDHPLDLPSLSPCCFRRRTSPAASE
jgi:hypothetical protein